MGRTLQVTTGHDSVYGKYTGDCSRGLFGDECREDNKVRELITLKVLHTSLLNTTVIAFTLLSLGIYAPMPAPSPPFKTILELVLWNGLQSCHCFTPDVISVIKMPYLLTYSMEKSPS